MTNKHDERVEEKVEYVAEVCNEVEFLHGVPVKLPSRTKEILRSRVRKTLNTLTKEVREQTLAEVREVIANKKTREMQTGENLGKYKAFQRGEEHMRSKLLDTLENK